MRPTACWRARFVGAAVVCLFVVLPVSASTLTVGTFADPSPGPLPALFTADLVNNQVHASWSDPLHTMNLKILGTTYQDVQFTMQQPGSALPVQIVSYSSPAFGGTTGPGEIDFFPAADPSNILLSVVFDRARFSIGLFGASEPVRGDTVSFSGSALGTKTFMNEIFSFSFANQIVQRVQAVPVLYTATASFTSSGSEIPVPEPAVIALLSFGWLATLMGRRRRR